MGISYSDSEVKTYHPLCEKALNEALKRLKVDKEYGVIHHKCTGSLEMDFVIQHRTTGKYICVVEVKRTPSDVHSTRYQFQAMSYVQQNAGQTEKPFYILTNLEYAYAFRYDAEKPKAFQQVLKPGFENIGSFETDSENVFFEKLTVYFYTKLKSFLSDDFEYLVTLDQFVTFMKSIKNDKKKWKTSLAFLLYEYIRGSFMFINREGLSDIRLFHNDVSKICNEAARINFKDIFSYTNENFEKNISVDSDLMQNLFGFGEQNVTGDAIANILHQIVSSGHEHDGDVPTDMELARIVAELAFYVNGKLETAGLICDPAAGSGNLLSAAIDSFDIHPCQILANDWNEQLAELLSLRLGLKFAHTISKENSPIIETKNIAELTPDFFANVKIILMNPPFVAGINCVERKEKLIQKLRCIENTEIESTVGQMPLEVPFLELIIHLVEKGTTIACIFPKTHLTARGAEAKSIRKLLLEKFGLQIIFSYPGTAIFDDVTKDTCVLVGKAMQLCEEITVISSYDNIPDLDVHRFSKSLSKEMTDVFKPIMPGIVGKKITRKELTETIETGWRSINSEMTEAIDFVNNVFRNSEKFALFETFNFETKRGGAGNNGGSDLLFFDSNEALFYHFKDKIIVLRPGMRNARQDTFLINNGDARFLDSSSNSPELIDEIISCYMRLPQKKNKQPRKIKSKFDWLKILDKESESIFPKNSVLIPRLIRSTGRVYLSQNPIFVSTNFVVCSLPDEKTAMLMASWIATIFYQLICEVSSKDNEGMRKMEVVDIEKTYFPDFSKLSDEFYKEIEDEMQNLAFLNLRNVKIRTIDNLWARVLFGKNGHAVLKDAARMLSFVVDKRNP